MSNLTCINQRLATSLPNSTSLCSPFQPITLHTLPLLELLFPMCSQLTISRDRQICICIDLSLALSPLFPQDHYSDSGPHFFQQLLFLCIFAENLSHPRHLPDTGNIAGTKWDSSLALMGFVCYCWERENKQIWRMKKGTKKTKKGFNILILVSSIQENKISIIILNPSFLILLFLSVTCNKTQRNSKFCIGDGKK